MEEPAEQVVERIMREMLIGPQRSGNATITVNAGGVGVWIATTACIVMLACMMVLGIWVSRELTRIDARAAEQEVKIDRANTFLSAIWANAPELEKKVKAEQEKDSAK